MNEGGSHQKIEVVFVSADKDERAFQDHVKHMPWLVIDFNDPLRTILLRHFRVGVSAPFITLLLIYGEKECCPLLFTCRWLHCDVKEILLSSSRLRLRA